MKAVVIGSTGQLGQDLMRAFGAEAVGLGHADLDVTDAPGVAAVLRELRPDWVINTAAYHRVDDCEDNPGLAFAVNAVGAAHVARAAAATGAGVVFFSTDYVFGGAARQRGHPYSELDPPQPRNAYGVSKMAGERLVMRNNPRHLVLRSAGLYGTTTSRKGWTFPELMMKKARAGESLRVVNDQILSPTYTADLAARVKELVERNTVGLLHLTNAGECSWFEFASATLRLAALAAPIEPITTTPSPGRAARPMYSALTSVHLQTTGLRPLRRWEDGLKAYLRARDILLPDEYRRPEGRSTE